ncbi:MAG TPA: heparinase II/III family protein [Devosiaceae bacterium]
MRFLARRWSLGAADFAASMPLVRWTWRSLSDDRFEGALPEFRPTDVETIIDMMQGRYLLASKLVDTGGISPFAVRADNEDWLSSLHSFSWLRHFREARDDGSRRFARTLVFDWIGRHGRFDRRTWATGLCAQRVMNWLRHYSLLVEGATPEQTAAIGRTLGAQIQSLRMRAGFTAEPADAALASMAVVGAALSVEKDDAVARRVARLKRLLDRQISADGLHRSRNAKTQLALLVELSTVHQALMREHRELAAGLSPALDLMHKAFDRQVLGSGEPAYFNGSGQLPHDIVVAVQAQGLDRQYVPRSAIGDGYIRLQEGGGVIVADGGMVPPLDYAGEAASGALGFEFSYGRDLVIGNCGPAPAELSHSKALFRRGIAHSAPTINAESAVEEGGHGSRLRQRGPLPELSLDAKEPTLIARTFGFEHRFGVALERRLTLLSEGRTLVGQDRMIGGKGQTSGLCTLRFHLAPGAEVLPLDNSLLVRLSNGSEWTFLWEGAEVHEEESVRQSAYFGLHRTRQIILEAPVAAGTEIAWIFTLDRT